MFHCKWFAIIVTVLAAACASPPPPLKVTTHVVRDQVHNGDGSDPMARNDKLRLLHGAVSMEERKKLLGEYYTIQWKDLETKQGPASITFEYQQGATGSRIKSIRRDFPKYTTSGTAEVAIIGDDYFEGGRVLAWRATLRRGGEIIATRQSYLWQ
jgi:hypothetical protein